MTEEKEKLFPKFISWTFILVGGLLISLSILGTFNTGPFARHPSNLNPKIGWVNKGDYQEKCEGSTMILQSYSIGHALATIPNNIECE